MMAIEDARKAFENTADFEARAADNPGLAEKWMHSMSIYKYRGNEKWLEERQRTILRIYCERGNQAGAQRMVEQARDYFSQLGRINKYERFFGSYTGIRLDPKPDPDRAGEPIIDSASFRQALLEKRFDEAQAWLDDPSTQAKYEKYPGVLRDRQRELKEKIDTSKEKQ